MLHNEYTVTFCHLRDTDHVSSHLHSVNDHNHVRTDEVYYTNNQEVRASFTIKWTNVRNRSTYSLGFV